MKAIFLGYAVDERESELFSGISIAGNKFQLNIIRHLSPYFDSFTVLTIPPIAPYPNDYRIVFHRFIGRLENCFYVRVPFLNIKGIKQLCQVYMVLKALRKYVDKDTILITFNMYPQLGIPASLIKKILGVKLACVLADLPIDDKVKRNPFSGWIINKSNKLTKALIRRCDKTIVLNEEAWILYADNTEHIVIDGGVDDSIYMTYRNRFINYSYTRKNILYCGSLNKYSGIVNLINAMQYVENNEITLEVYGKGEFQDFVENSQNPRIKYCGTVSNEQMLKLQSEAWLLINPRPITDDIAKVTFPSKIFEYMMSGTPVISTRLNGFSADYDGKIIFAEDGSPEELGRCINMVDKMHDEELVKYVYNAFDFLEKKKKWSIQCKTIAEFLLTDKITKFCK